MNWKIARCMDVVEEVAHLFDVNTTDNKTNDT